MDSMVGVAPTAASRTDPDSEGIGSAGSQKVDLEVSMLAA
jgi:hypothetical protein